MRRRPARRGITLIETCVACAMSTVLVYLVAMSGIEFTRGAHLIAARADLMREADLAVAHLVDSLRDQGEPPVVNEGGGLRIGTHVYNAAAGTLSRDGVAVAWHVQAIDLDGETVVLTMAMPDVVENRRTGETLERTVKVTVVTP